MVIDTFQDKFFSLSKDLFAIASREGYFIELSATWHELLGWSAEELKSKPFIEFIHPDDRKLTAETLSVINQGLVHSEITNRYLTKDGKYVYLFWSSYVDHSTDLIYAIARDVTQREQLRKAVTACTQSIPDQLLIMGKDGYLQHLNVDGIEHFSYKLPRAKSYWSDHFPASIEKSLFEYFEKSLQEQKTHSFSYEFTEIGEETQYYHMRFSPLDETHVILWLRNKTHDTLAQMALEEQKLKSIQMAKMSSLGQMAAGVAHEMNTPLTLMVGHLSLLSKKLGSNQEIKHHLHDMEVAIERTIKIVKALRNFSFDDSSEPLTEISVNELIDETLSFCRERISFSKLKLELDIDQEFFVLGRPIELSQVLLNIINNAIDAVKLRSEDDQAVVENWIKIKSMQKDEAIMIVVSDSGAGIEARYREKVFTPFFTTKKKGEGTGLGLSLSRDLARGLGGDLVLLSEERTSFALILNQAH